MKARVPVLGTIGKSLLIDPEATKGATIGRNLMLPDGSIPTLAQLQTLFGGDDETPTAANTIWRLVREIPANVLEVEQLATSGIVVRQADGDWLTRSIAVEADGLLQVDDADGDDGNPTLGAAPIAALSVWGRSANTVGKPAPMVAGTEKHVLRRVSNVVGFGALDSTYISDFAERAQDEVFGVIADSARIDFAYDDALNAFTADLIAGSVANSYLANMAAATIKGRASGAGAGAPGDLTGAEVATIIGYTAGDVLTKLLTVDGAGSGLDADLLDGQSSAAFLLAASYTAADVLAKLLTVDGAGSLLDADFLDGLSSADYFQTANQLLAVDTGYSFASDPDTSMQRVSSNVLGFYTGGTQRGRFESAGLIIEGPLPAVRLVENDVAVDATTWRFSANAGVFRFTALNDALTTSSDGLLLVRTGAVVSRIEFGNSTDLPLIDMIGGPRWRSIISPTQITANQNNYNPTGLSSTCVVRLDSDAARDITGMATLVTGGVGARLIALFNVGAFNITLKHENAGSSAGQRFSLPNAVDCVLTPGSGAWMWYDNTTTRWRNIRVA